ncbi:EAL domain-containing response regulator [Uliginosibacterium sediminicola]|uniref:EAL domain-containing response regulator n=1 Tax=Uliginosibacterium sediminicola TaxID=2024550 RepID=A0ABU9Z1K5_9RHOO
MNTSLPISRSLLDQGVLVVDDSAVQRMHTVSALQAMGISLVTQAGDGIQALQQLDSLQPIPALMVIDLEMPVMDGVELIHRLAQRGAPPAVIVASSREQVLIESVESMIKDLGIPLLGAVRKPVTEDTLRKLIGRMDITVGRRRTDAVSRPGVCYSQLFSAIHDGQIRPYFQPKVELDSGFTRGVEALARWVTPEGRVIPPADFIELAEQHGLMNELTLSILEQSLAAADQWAQQGLSLSIAINLSPSSLGDMKLADAILARVEAAHFPHQRIVLEITESVMMQDAAALRDLIRLRLRGFGLSIDDYGTGFSSMQQLSRVPFSELKIDRSFVDGAHHRENLRAILESAIALGKRLGMSTVAEGVEQIEDWNLLKSLGCQSCQGYLLSPPVPAEAIPNFIAQQAKVQ